MRSVDSQEVRVAQPFLEVTQTNPHKIFFRGCDDRDVIVCALHSFDAGQRDRHDPVPSRTKMAFRYVADFSGIKPLLA